MSNIHFGYKSAGPWTYCRLEKDTWEQLKSSSLRSQWVFRVNTYSHLKGGLSRNLDELDRLDRLTDSMQQRGGDEEGTEENQRVRQGRDSWHKDIWRKCVKEMRLNISTHSCHICHQFPTYLILVLWFQIHFTRGCLVDLKPNGWHLQQTCSYQWVTLVLRIINFTSIFKVVVY